MKKIVTAALLALAAPVLAQAPGPDDPAAGTSATAAPTKKAPKKAAKKAAKAPKKGAKKADAAK